MIGLVLSAALIPYGFVACARVGTYVYQAAVSIDEPSMEKRAHEVMRDGWQNPEPEPWKMYSILKVDEAWVEQLDTERRPCETPAAR